MTKKIYKPGKWFHVNSIDEMQDFYMSRLPVIREAARKCGYAIGLHGSCRRDFDLLAMPWVEKPKSKDELAEAISMAACGFSQKRYIWENKGSGRFAAAFAICWPEWHGMISAGCLDLSVMQTQPADKALQEENNILRMQRDAKLCTQCPRNARPDKMKEALSHISRMKLFPDDGQNSMTLSAAIHIAKEALSESEV